MKKTPLLCCLFFVFGFSILSAQNSFKDKKRNQKNALQVNINAFTYPKIKSIRSKQSLTKSKKQSFQMQDFNLMPLKRKYLHTTVKKDQNGQVYLIKSQPTKTAKQRTRKQDITTACNEYLKAIAPILRVKQPETAFKMVAEHTDGLGKRHIKLQQHFQGVRIFGSEIILHLNKAHEVSSLTGRSVPTPLIADVVPKITQKEAFQKVYSALSIKRAPNSTTEKPVTLNETSKLSLSDFESAELVLWHNGNAHELVWHLTVFENIKDRWEYFVNAKSAKIVNRYNHTCTLHHEFNTATKPTKDKGFGIHMALPPTVEQLTDLNGVTRQINGFEKGGDTYMIDTTKPMFNGTQSELPQKVVGGLVNLDFNNQPYNQEEPSFFFVSKNNGNYTSPTAVSSHYNANVSYEYFRQTFGRNSINGQGGTVFSLINVADEDGGGFDNAFWNGQFMAYGNGRVAFTPFAGSLDVGGHEMSHGVVQNTANLVYQDQPGAINESFADIFGVMIDRDDWRLGEDIVTNVFPSGALRDMQNPNNGGNGLGDTGWQPKDMSEFYNGPQDNGGVHINSGIPNRAYYLFATEIGKDKAEQVYYKALTDYLTASSQFVDLRIAVIQSATDLHGASSVEVQAAETAFDTVGITDGAPTDTNEDLPPALGDNFILSADVNTGDVNTLYISDTNGTGFIPVSQTPVFRKPSVSDDGSLAIFVTENNTINGIDLNRQNPNEVEISDDALWSSIALSKDGNRLAVVANDESNRIFILDLVSQTNREFTLFNPTTSSDGSTTGDVLYPDALEWDYTGEYLIYDALNSLTNPSGSTIEYWDVGVIKVWDNTANTYGDGSIQKLFTNLPEGVSIGNPSLSKTSNNIIAFDYFNELEDVYSVLTANIETNTLVEVWRQDKLAFPNYSSTDDKLLFDAFDTSDNEVIAVIGLGADKLTPQGDPSILITDAKWGIWYTEGGRDTGNNDGKEITDFRFNALNPPIVATISGTNINALVPQGTNVTNLIATFTASVGSSVSVNGNTQQSGATTNNFTNPLSYRVTAADGTTKDFLVTVTVENPDDDDNDGVPNALDQCPATPTGTTVDVTGCEIFSLPNTNFSVSSIGESCISSNNGSITITAAQNLQYVAILSGGGTTSSQNFSDTTTFGNLQGGNYNVCLTVVGQPGYESCYAILVNEPEPLSVTSKVNLTAKSVTLNLNGATRYIVTLNETTYTTTENELTLALSKYSNTLTVKTDKDCQGLFEDHIIRSDAPILYPNPLVTEAFTVQLMNTDTGTEKVDIAIFAMDGTKISSTTGQPQNGEIKVRAANLASGLYLVKINSLNQSSTFKIIKP